MTTAEKLQHASELVRQAPLERDQVIREALAEGWTQRQIAAVTGLSPGRIGQIAVERV